MFDPSSQVGIRVRNELGLLSPPLRSATAPLGVVQGIFNQAFLKQSYHLAALIDSQIQEFVDFFSLDHDYWHFNLLETVVNSRCETNPRVFSRRAAQCL